MSNVIEAYALNIAANPHPAGTYTDALRNASAKLVKVRGNDSAKITEPLPDRKDQNFYVGRILVWTEIDWKGRWLDLEKEDALPPDVKAKIVVETTAKPNYRVFQYAFNTVSHILYFESKNEFGETFGPNVGRRFFSRLLSPELLGQSSPEISVTLIPEEAAIDQILDMPRLRKLTIRVTKPNADTTGSSARRRIFEELEAANAKQLEIVYTKEAGAEKLERTPLIERATDAARENGFVKGESRATIDGKAELSTNDLPKRLALNLDSGESFVARIIATFREREN